MVFWLGLAAGLVSCFPPLFALARGVARVRGELLAPRELGPGAAPPVLARHFEPAVVDPAGELWLRSTLLAGAAAAAGGAVLGGAPGAVIAAVSCGLVATVVGLPVLFAGVVLARAGAHGVSFVHDRRVLKSDERDPGAGHVTVLAEPAQAGQTSLVPVDPRAD